jgi:L-alanine-DL-glutamate epimerase-like enolase superfamily enzyme
VKPAVLAGALAELPVTVSKVQTRFAHVPVEDYGGAGRPATFVALSGGGHTGFGELVSFEADEHARFARQASDLLHARQGRVAELVDPRGAPHERAALEAAAIDLALRQAGRSLADLCGAAFGRLRWVASFGPLADPRRRLARLAAAGPMPALKLDVHPGWSEAVIADLQRLEVVTLDWKDAGSVDQGRRLSDAFRQAIFEDPPPGCGHARVARDRPLAGGVDVQAALERGELVNVKGPRMGGFLELLRGLSGAGAGCFYFGGMYEVGPGREQARQLAAIVCPEAPNDLAPFGGSRSSLVGDSPSLVRLDVVGFGATFDWSGGPLG